jgi:hypothetical protein
MATNVNIGGDGTLFVGEDKTFDLEVLDTAGVPVNISAWTMIFDVRLHDNSTDPAIFSKVPTVIGVYNVTRASNTQRARVVLTDTELNTVTTKTYRQSWKRMDDGFETVLLYGNFAPQKATAP